MVRGSKEEQNENGVKVTAHLEYYRLTPRAQHHVRALGMCACLIMRYFDVCYETLRVARTSYVV